MQITLAILNARMSPKSFRNWSLPAVLQMMNLMLSKFSLIIPLVCICFYISRWMLQPKLILHLLKEQRAGSPFSDTASTTAFYLFCWWFEIWYAIVHSIFLKVFTIVFPLHRNAGELFCLNFCYCTVWRYFSSQRWSFILCCNPLLMLIIC